MLNRLIDLRFGQEDIGQIVMHFGVGRIEAKGHTVLLYRWIELARLLQGIAIVQMLARIRR